MGEEQWIEERAMDIAIGQSKDDVSLLTLDGMRLQPRPSYRLK